MIESSQSVESPSRNNGVIDYSSIHSTAETPLSSGLVTLSIHEALTFDGVELALHPDVFHKKEEVSKKKEQNKQQQQTVPGSNEQLNRQLRPGDLVEIRVWSVRPGMKATDNHNISAPDSTNSGKKGNAASATTATGSTYHSRNPSLVSLASSMLSPSVPSQSSAKGTAPTYHSRNPSLVTLSSIQSPGSAPLHLGMNNAARGSGVYGGGTTSLVNTPLSSVKTGEIAANVLSNSAIAPPPLMSIVGDNRHSPMARPSIGGSHDKDDEEKDALELHGEYLLDSCSTERKGEPASTTLSTASSSSLVGSTLPLDSLVSSVPLLAQKNKISFSTIETDSKQGHSRDSSFVTSSSVMHVSLPCYRLL